MARHDREESLEEQLAWLDAIKESEDVPVSVSASTGSADEQVASPYPKDPWLLVPAHHDTPTPPLFRAAVDSVYGPAAAEEVPSAESEAGEWLGTAATREDTGEEAPSPPPAAADDPFHAPLKPLPRPDDTDTYALTFTPPPPPSPSTPSLPTPSPAETAEPPKDDDTTRVPPADWSRPADEAARQPAEPSAQDPASGPSSGPASVPAVDDRDAWADTLPRTERPQWSRSLPADEPAPPAEPRPDPAPGLSQPQEPWPHRQDAALEQAQAQELGQEHTHAQGQALSPEHAQGQAESQEPARERPEPEVGRGRPEPEVGRGRPEPPLRQERPQWTEQQEWRPAERDIPPQPARPRHRPAPVPVFTASPRPPVTGRPTADSLDPESLLRGRRNAPSKGWRRLVYKASGGWIKPGEPPEVRRRRELVSRARTPVTTGHHRVAVLSLKGGVGKTTTTVGLGATLAQMRGDRVIAIDANPDRGTLSDKLVLETSATVRDLLNERDQVKRYVDIRAFTSQAPSRLEVLASDRDPSVSEAFSGADYQAVSQVLENFYSICITDCGTGLLHSAMGGVLGLADQIVLVSSPSVDGARAASATLDWLEAHHYGDLVKNATVVLCSVRPRSKSAVDIAKLEAHFAARCRAVIRVPYDPHLEEGAEIDLDRLQPVTRDAYLQLAACVGDGFAGQRETG
ncbi:MAG TPA: AAA family ATPase [Nonomuraea sp.]|nr:AAA family ATPase [Nonomuraea sp.]